MKTLTKLTLITALFALFGAQSTNAQIADSTKISTKQSDSQIKNQADSTNTNLPAKESSKYSFVDNTFTNKNMFFGMNYGNMPLNQLYVETGNKNVSLGTWSNFNIEKANLLEVDLTATVKKEFKFKNKYTLLLQPGVGYYTFPNSETPDYKEIYLKTSFTGLPVDVSLRTGKLFGEGFSNTDISSGSTIDLNVSKTFKLSDKLSVSGNAEVVYNSTFFCDAKGISHTSATASVVYSPLENISITGSVIGQKKVDKDIDGVKTEGYFKLSATYNFK
jgi:hypothetical protein